MKETLEKQISVGYVNILLLINAKTFHFILKKLHKTNQKVFEVACELKK